jgi:hypothetical protein
VIFETHIEGNNALIMLVCALIVAYTEGYWKQQKCSQIKASVVKAEVLIFMIKGKVVSVLN